MKNIEHSKNTPLIIRASIVTNNKMFKNIAENAKDCKTILGKIVIVGSVYLNNLIYSITRDAKGNNKRNHLSLCS
jgi:hypothetical protein